MNPQKPHHKLDSPRRLLCGRLWRPPAIMAMLIVAAPPGLWAQDSFPEPAVPSSATEDELIGEARRFHRDAQSSSKSTIPALGRVLRARQALVHVDALLERYPESGYQEEALIIKLSVLGQLARTQPEYLRQLLELTNRLSASKLEGRLAEENAYYAIEAFVLGARFEGMSEQRRHLGALERYEAFLKDFPDSGREPILRASLARSALVLGKQERAREEVERLRKSFPDHPATRRAAGELYRATAMGTPFALAYRNGEGNNVDTREWRGSVIVVHFWASWNPESLRQFPMLKRLYETHGPTDLRLLGVNADMLKPALDEALAKNRPAWPQYYDFKGFENEFLVSMGVVELPTYFVIDRNGILRSIDDGRQLEERVESLLKAEKAN